MNHYLRNRTERKVAVVGSRDYTNLDWVGAVVASLPDNTMVITGGAPGVDRAAEQAATRHHIPLYVFLAAWDLQGRGAGLARNSQIVEAADELIAFWDGKSRGTLDTIRKARHKGIPVKVYDPAGGHPLGHNGEPVEVNDVTLEPLEPVSNNDLVRVELARAVPPWDICTGCQRPLDKDEKFVYVLLGHERLGIVKLCRYCVLKIHRTSSQMDL